MVQTFCNFRETEYMQYSEKQLRFAGTNEWSQTQYKVIMPFNRKIKKETAMV